MKKTLLLVFIAVFGTETYSQVSASASFTSRATIIEPIRIDKAVDLDFGNIISSNTPGSVTLTPDGSRTTQGVQVSNSVAGTVSPAEALVTHGNNSYSISLPESVTLYNEGDRDKVLVIEQFEMAAEPGPTSDVLKIGATLQLEASQAPGFYSSDEGFNVTVSYN